MKQRALIGFLALVMLFSLNALVHAHGEEAEHAILNLINQYRQQHGLPTVVISPALNNAAQFHSRWMANNNCFSHQCGLEPDFGQRLLNANYRWQAGAGENIAAGRSDAGRIFQLWLNSPSHTQTLLDSRWKAVGISRVYNANSRYRWYWTVDFGDVVDSSVSANATLAWFPIPAIPLADNPLALSSIMPRLDADGVTFSLRGLGIRSVRVQVFDLFGKRVFAGRAIPPQALRWNLLDSNGVRLANGTYLYVVTVRGSDNQVLRTNAKKLIVLN